MYRYRYVDKQVEIFFFMAIDSQEFGGWEVPQSSVCKRENQESQWCNSVWVRKPKNLEHHRPKAGEDGSPSFTLPLSFCSIQVSNGLDVAEPHCSGWSLLRLLTQMLTSSGLTYRHTQKSYLSFIWASFSPIKMIHTINHHITLVPWHH